MTNNTNNMHGSPGPPPSSFPKLSLPEAMALSIAAAFISTVFIISGWSLLLVSTGKTGGGGPLGAIARFLTI